MERHDPFAEMDRMFEQLRASMFSQMDMGRSDPRTGLSGWKGIEGAGRGREDLKTSGRKTLDTFGRDILGRERTSKEGTNMESRNMTGMNMDLKKHGEEYVFVADLPGFETEEISLSYADDALVVTAKSESSDEMESDTDETAIRGAFSRSRSVSERVAIPEAIVEEDISASYRNGVLEVHLPLVQSESVDDETKIDIAD